VRRDYFCRTSPTLVVITPVDGRLLKSSSSMLKLVGGGNGKQLASKIKAHTFSQTWRTLFVHFDHQKINGEGLERIAASFNELHQQENKEEEENEEKNKKNTMKCVNLFVLLKNISPSESEEEIAEALKDIGYNVEKVERFKGLPMAKVLLKTSNNVKIALQDKEIRI
ncbi:hypothetical protein RFI_39580, partial [Reticulomyxa filosa]